MTSFMLHSEDEETKFRYLPYLLVAAVIISSLVAIVVNHSNQQAATIQGMTIEHGRKVRDLQSEIENMRGTLNSQALDLSKLKQEKAELLATNKSLNAKLAAAEQKLSASQSKMLATEQAVKKITSEKKEIEAKHKAALIPQSGIWAWIKSYSPWSL